MLASELALCERCRGAYARLVDAVAAREAALMLRERAADEREAALDATAARLAAATAKATAPAGAPPTGVPGNFGAAANFARSPDGAVVALLERRRDADRSDPLDDPAGAAAAADPLAAFLERALSPEGGAGPLPGLLDDSMGGDRAGAVSPSGGAGGSRARSPAAGLTAYVSVLPEAAYEGLQAQSSRLAALADALSGGRGRSVDAPADGGTPGVPRLNLDGGDGGAGDPPRPSPHHAPQGERRGGRSLTPRSVHSDGGGFGGGGGGGGGALPPWRGGGTGHRSPGPSHAAPRSLLQRYRRDASPGGASQRSESLNPPESASSTAAGGAGDVSAHVNSLLEETGGAAQYRAAAAAALAAGEELDGDALLAKVSPLARTWRAAPKSSGCGSAT